MKNKDVLFSAFLMLMRPAARLLLRCGVTWKETAELVKMTLVGVAAQEFGKHGRPANSSRIALATGLGRREVKRLRDMLAEPQPAAASKALDTVNVASRILSAWHQDSDFTTETGKPRLLSVDGNRGFEALAKRYAPDIPSTAVLKVLMDVGAIRKTPGGKLRVLERYYMPTQLAGVSIARSGAVLGDVSNTVVHNLFAGDGSTRFEARATNLRVKRGAEKAFQVYLENSAMGFLETADEWLSRRETRNDDDATERLGVGIYMIKDDS